MKHVSTARASCLTDVTAQRFMVVLMVGAATLLCLLARPAFSLDGGRLPALSSSPGLSSATQFLPVEQAYQLEPLLVGEELHLHWNIAPGYYLYKDKFSVVVEQGEPNDWEQKFESGRFIYDEYYEKNLEVYYDRTRVVLQPAILGKARKHSVLAVTSQGCADAGLCYPPRTQYLSIDFAIGTVGETSSPKESEFSRISNSGGLQSAVQSPIRDPNNAELAVDQTGRNQPGIWILLGSALLGGLILNLMPCVFPVLSIKVLGVTAAHLEGHDKHAHGLAYAAGVILSFVGIAAALIALRSAGSAIGWGFQLQSPITIAALAYLFFLMALGFNGQFTLGARLMNIGQNTTTGNGVWASFMTGVLATVVASPCTAPFMGTALGVAITQPASIALLVFATLGLGMAAPFLFLTWIPGLAARLPAPGPWMETFRQFLAFPLYGSVIWLLWVLGRQTDVSTAALVALGLLFVALAIWLLGKGRALPARIIASTLLVIGLLLPTLLGGFGKRTDSFWEPYTAQRLEALRAANQAVFVNLTADWCITCLANEKVALSSERFETALDDRGIYYLKGDWSNRNPEITELLAKYGRNGVPLYLFYPAGGEARILPQLLTETIVLRALANQ